MKSELDEIDPDFVPTTFVDSVLIRPGMYTITGTFGEVVCFLNGFYSGMASHQLSHRPEILHWSRFKGWLVSKLGPDTHHPFQALAQQYPDNTLEVLWAEWKEFKLQQNIP